VTPKTMNDVLKSIRGRRSVRRFTDRAVPDALIERLLEAGRWAPSGLNNQPWRFCILRDKTARERLAAFTKYGAVIRRAPVVIVVALDHADSYNREKDLMALGAAIQNILLAAASLRLGACWLGEILNKKEEVARLLRWDKDLEMAAALALGYPKAKPGKGSRRPLRQLILHSRPGTGLILESLVL